MASVSPSGMQKAVRWHPPSYDIRVDTIEIPRIVEPDDVIVKVKLAALCGSDLHIYRGVEGVDKIHTCGHEFIGEVVALGNSYRADAHANGRPQLYSSLKIGALFGSPALEGGQAEYVRVPKAGGTLFNLTNTKDWSTKLSDEDKERALAGIADSSLLLLADILPTGVFAALQVLGHPKVQPIITGRPWPLSFFPGETGTSGMQSLTHEDTILTIAIIGLGPVGVCATVSLLDMLATRGLSYRVVAIDPVEERREKITAIYSAIDESGKGSGEFVAQSIEEAKTTVATWTKGVGCTAIMEVVGNNSALALAYDLVRPFGVITSVGVHAPKPLAFTGAQFYNKNVSLDFGRCPARAMFPMAFDLLVKRQDIFGGVGGKTSLVDKIVGFGEAVESYDLFDKAKCGKVIFDPSK